MAEDENSGKRKTGILIFGFIIVLIIFFVWFFINPESFSSFLSSAAFIVIILGIAGLVFYLVWYMFFKPQKVDITYMNKEKLVQSAKLSMPKGVIKDLYITGDKNHQSVNVGKISGWTRIQVFDVEYKDTEREVKKKVKGKDGKIEEVIEVVVETKEVAKKAEQDVFVIENKSFFGRLMGSSVVIRVDPEDHTQLVGDVFLRGFSLIKRSEYFFLNHDDLDEKKIDFNILQEAKRGVMFLMLSDLKTIVDNAIGINPRHQLDMEKDRTFRLPQSPPPQRPEI